jgi:hypothetical protein
MLNQDEIENLKNLEYDMFVSSVIKEMVEISETENLLSELISVSENHIKIQIIEELRILNLNRILDEK